MLHLVAKFTPETLGRPEDLPTPEHAALCGKPLEYPMYVLDAHYATDEPMPGPGVGPGQDDVRCPDCWKAWRESQRKESP